MFDLNQLALKGPEKIVDWPKVRKKIWPNFQGGGEGSRGRVRTAPFITLFVPGTPLQTTPLQKRA